MGTPFCENIRQVLGIRERESIRTVSGVALRVATDCPDKAKGERQKAKEREKNKDFKMALRNGLGPETSVTPGFSPGGRIKYLQSCVMQQK